ncbi:flagellar basal body-associated protein FliL [Methylococcus sp. EFPC2]|uniref:flagellar basal body-associated FliL family protein n=1 Tax=Methylococcus sp. EFPC2 TaxID=2812648 RepID=UPI0019681ABF|nr:flagellar basal body-associated FliL family protein [Methylococcus sp. EFPC2]QSA95537.1 flagellar basal body-associated FliL family protein [Methylococcus sp. EFPC2]
MRKLLGILTLLLAMSSGTQAAEGKKSGSETEGPQYVKLESVIVNLEGRRHYLRAEIQLLVSDYAVAEKIKTNMPALRHALIMLFSGRNPEQISTAEEREKLRNEAKAEVAKVLEHYKAGKGFEDLFFTDFMVQ